MEQQYRDHIRSEREKIDQLKIRRIEMNSKIDNEIAEREKKIKRYNDLLQKNTKGG